MTPLEKCIGCGCDLLVEEYRRNFTCDRCHEEAEKEAKTMTPKWLEDVRVTGAGVLPRDAELELMAASRRDDPRDRQRAIDRAYDRTYAMHPNLFRN